jgi:heme/copper-type cytochrome/quinol oxidase subunit 2
MHKLKRNKTKVNGFKLFVLSFKLFTHALRWVLGPTLMVVGFALSLWFLNLNLFIFMIIIFIVYLSLINYLSVYLINSLDTKTKGKNTHFFKIMLGSIPCYFLHGLSAYRALILSLIAKVSKKKIEKGKTVMRQNIK